MKNRSLIIIPLCAAFVIITLAQCTSGKEKSLGYLVAEVKKGSVVNSITATGTIEPIIQVEVGTQVSGIISKIYVDFNSQVKKGDMLAELDRTTLEADLKSSEATLQSSKTEYEYQVKNHNRIKNLYDKKLISDSEYESAKYSLDKAKSAYEKSQSDILRVRQNLRYATIYSPIDGVVLNHAVDEGQTVAASFNTPTLFLIANDLRNMQVIADIDEADIGVVKDGQKVRFTVDAYPGENFSGEVTQVRLEPTTTSNVVTYEVVVAAPNPDLKLKPGLTANITITTEEKNDIIVIPSKALKFNPQSDQASNSGSNGGGLSSSKSVWISESGNKIREAFVKTGSSDGIHTEIIEGLKEGDRVVTGIRSAADVDADTQNSSAQSNPFMPARPGQQNKKR